MRRFAGIELGGTKCVATLAEGPETVLDRRTVPTAGPEETLAALEAILAGWWADAPFVSLGIASFGPVDLDPASPTWGHVTSSPKPGWQRIDVAPRLARPFGVPTAFDTDVNGAARAEMTWGAGRGMRDFAYVTVGTGVGVGLIANGEPMRGFQHCELGHVRIARLPGDDWEGACPYHGPCVEGLVAGGSIKKRLGLDDASALPADHPVWDSVAHALAQLCHTIVCAAAPRRIVIGGGVVSGQKHLLPRIEPLLRESIAGYMSIPEDAPYVTAPGLGDDAGPLGPIALALGAA
ncbi:ROK family protein [Sphingomonas parva]|uniref:fructokinase n=1 Tax=Sphingomonas parva TaxID=2555898 RepID=A0A4Y8ZSH1_9SPHN|nr:ROK family protein [Sphingomonas parva]TFI58961.1 ROK family protein [Sphingomonas parva]